MPDERVTQTTPDGSAARLPRIDWARIVRWTVVGTIVAVLLILVDLDRTGVNVLNLVQPGRQGPSHEVFQQDFPEAYPDLPAGVGHDGQQFYAIARDPLHPVDTASALGFNPRYRLQRILFPFLSWLLHPTGGGYGLVYTMIAVGFASLIAGGLAAGALSVTLGGPPWGALAFALMPGAYFALRLTTADNLAMALVLGALTLSLRERWRWAIVLGVLAVLTREASLIPLIGLTLWRRDLRGLLLTVVPAAAGGLWFLVLQSLLGGRYGNDDMNLFQGVPPSVPYWFSAEGFGAGATIVVSSVLVVAALVLRYRSPLAWSIGLLTAFLLFLSQESIYLFDNVSRTVMPQMILAVLALLGANGFRRASPPAIRLPSWRSRSRDRQLVAGS